MARDGGCDVMLRLIAAPTPGHHITHAPAPALSVCLPHLDVVHFLAAAGQQFGLLMDCDGSQS
jgi:hypothetical protein